MPVACQLRVLLARLNLDRARRNEPPLSLRRLAKESGVSLSTVIALNADHSQRVDFQTLDRLLAYFSRSLDVDIADLLVWEPAAEPPAAA